MAEGIWFIDTHPETYIFLQTSATTDVNSIYFFYMSREIFYIMSEASDLRFKISFTCFAHDVKNLT